MNIAIATHPGKKQKILRERKRDRKTTRETANRRRTKLPILKIETPRYRETQRQKDRKTAREARRDTRPQDEEKDRQTERQEDKQAKETTTAIHPGNRARQRDKRQRKKDRRAKEKENDDGYSKPPWRQRKVEIDRERQREKQKTAGETEKRTQLLQQPTLKIEKCRDRQRDKQKVARDREKDTITTTHPGDRNRDIEMERYSVRQRQKKREIKSIRNSDNRGGRSYPPWRHCDVLGQVNEAALPQHAGPQLNAHDAEDEEHEEAQQQDVPEHGQRVQQQHHQDTHA